eukprot:CAMPEP_0195291578 /NCGR_PEP_ID=MMETSP0707-20130614/7875_1 /TAXON_ID=33640 /ORGANISM="Asterionellopsis glacialis, Strain CCMP134" /LENGTH=404 /DNA_ID=CAMNT_0040351911 /DNA_START=31 /DNA_END=1245 /DNA_ORIENTATION=+
MMLDDEMLTPRSFEGEDPVSEPSRKKAKPAMKYKKAPGAPRRFKSAYMFFSTAKHPEIRERLRHEGNQDPKTTHIAKLVSAEWKSLPKEEREKWDEMAREDKARFEVEKTMYTGPWKVPANKRSQKDPSAPKRPMSSFLSFSNSKRASTKQQHPEKSNAEISRMLAEMWRDAPQEERQVHIDKEAGLREEYKIAMAAWKKNAEDELNATRTERENAARKAAANQMSIEPQSMPLDLNSMNAPQTGTALGIPNMTGTTSNQFYNFLQEQQNQQQQMAQQQAFNVGMFGQQHNLNMSQNLQQQFGQQNNFGLMNHQGQFSGLNNGFLDPAASLSNPPGASQDFGGLENNIAAGAYGGGTDQFGGFQNQQFSQGFVGLEQMNELGINEQLGNDDEPMTDFTLEHHEV